MRSFGPKADHMPNSILIVSASDQFNMIVRKSLRGFTTIDIKKSTALARRRLLERDFDLVVINAPLPDETGEEFALDAAERSGASVLVCVPRDVHQIVMEHTVDHGIITLAKPFPAAHLDRAIRFMVSMQSRILELEAGKRKAQQKAEEIQIVSRAKLLLMEKKGMSEDEAHRLINRQAMDQGLTRRLIAEKILEELE